MTTNLFETLAQVAEILVRLDKNWALVGGLAVSSYVEPRFTRDIDIAVAVNDDTEAEQFIHSWVSFGFMIDSVIEQEATGRLAPVDDSFGTPWQGAPAIRSSGALMAPIANQNQGFF